MNMKPLLFLKLGGSLITDKGKPHTHHPKILQRLAEEIAEVYKINPELRLILGHGSGSFGHVPGKQYSTRNGVKKRDEWRGFIEVWREAAALNSLVMEALHNAGLPAISYPPSAGITANNGEVFTWNLTPLKSALEAGLLPVVYGDVAFDNVLGGTILSTEDLFNHLAHYLSPARILLAGIEPGVWSDFPICSKITPEISPDNYPRIEKHLNSSASTDVTGGMKTKVTLSLKLAQEISGLEVLIFSGKTSGNITKVLNGGSEGTIIHG